MHATVYFLAVAMALLAQVAAFGIDVALYSDSKLHKLGPTNIGGGGSSTLFLLSHLGPSIHSFASRLFNSFGVNFGFHRVSFCVWLFCVA